MYIAIRYEYTECIEYYWENQENKSSFRDSYQKILFNNRYSSHYRKTVNIGTAESIAVIILKFEQDGL